MLKVMMRYGGHFMDGAIPAEIVEHLNEFLPEFGDLNHEELLQHQESVYQSLKRNDLNKEKLSYNGQSSDWSWFSELEHESSRLGSSDSQQALDEALARALQELEDDFDDLDISPSASTSTENRDVGSMETPVMPLNHVRGDDVDTDSMTYEQLQSLGESVGSVNKGLSEEVISSLPNFKYKKGVLSMKKEKQECIICVTEFKNGNKVTTLPCAHQYHSKCISPWLQDHKHCPVCMYEVSVDQSEADTAKIIASHS